MSQSDNPKHHVFCRFPSLHQNKKHLQHHNFSAIVSYISEQGPDKIVFSHDTLLDRKLVLNFLDIKMTRKIAALQAAFIYLLRRAAAFSCKQ